MKTFLIALLLVSGVTAGEISDAFFKAKKERSDAEAKRLQEERNQIDEETNSAKRFDMLAKRFQLMQRETGRGIQKITNSGGTEIAFGNIVTNHGISEIGLERTGCFGTCPAYTFVIANNGKCRYEGGKFAKLEGKKTGRVSVIEFHRLAELLLRIQYFSLQDEYTAMITDLPSVYTTAVLNGKRKTIDDYAGLGPAELWAVEQLLDGILTRVKWDQ
jgi:hypothetical protein